MSYHGRASISRTRPRALAICDRCGFTYNYDSLQMQQEWRGSQMQNTGLLVCESCWDAPQEQLRTIILPPDPVPIADPRPENYELANNPNSPVGQSASPALAGSNIGNLIQGGGTYSAFMGSSVKPFWASANVIVSTPSFTNWVGKDWQANPSASFLPTTIDSTGLALVALGFEAVAPSDTGFLGTVSNDWAFYGSSDAATWTVLASGVFAGTPGETVSASNLGGTAYRYHKFAISGNGSSPAAVAYLAIDTNRGYQPL